MGAVPEARAAGADTRRIFTVANVARGLARRIDELPAVWVHELGVLPLKSALWALAPVG